MKKTNNLVMLMVVGVLSLGLMGSKSYAAATTSTDAFLQAIKKGDSAVLDYLLVTDTDLNVRDKYGRTPLMLVILDRKYHMVSQLIRAGADVNLVDQDGKTSLMYAALEGQIDLVDQLLQARAEVNAATKNGMTALMMAVTKGHYDMVALLIRNRAGVNAATGIVTTAVMMAAREGYHELVTLLIDAGANVNVVTKKSKTALMMAAEKGHHIVVDLLIGSGANVNEIDESNKTALMMAAGKGHHETVDLLIQAGADINAFSEAGKTAFIYANENGHDEIAAQLDQAVQRQREAEIARQEVERRAEVMRQAHEEAERRAIAEEVERRRLGDHIARAERVALRECPRRFVEAVVDMESVQIKDEVVAMEVADAACSGASDCSLCYVEPAQMRLGCAHEVCRDCIARMIKEHVIELENIALLRCGTQGCQQPFFAYDIAHADPAVVFGQDRELGAQYASVIDELALKDSPLYRACPGVNSECPDRKCRNGIFIEERQVGQIMNVQCTECRTTYCTGCEGHVHPDQTCDQARLERKDAFAETKDIKRCPTCQRFMAKGEGCQYMQCSRGCPEFCWFCKGIYHHQAHRCKDTQGDPNRPAVLVTAILSNVNTLDEARAKGLRLNHQE